MGFVGELAEVTGSQMSFSRYLDEAATFMKGLRVSQVQADKLTGCDGMPVAHRQITGRKEEDFGWSLPAHRPRDLCSSLLEVDGHSHCMSPLPEVYFYEAIVLSF